MTHPDRPISESYWILPGKFLAGEYAGHWDEAQTHSKLTAFLNAGFDTFIDLTTPGELIPYQPILEEEARDYDREIQYHRFPIPDKGVPSRETMTAILDTIDAAIAAGRKAYIHCLGGVGRTGTTVGCYLVRHGHSGAEALRQLAEWWQNVPKHLYHPCSPETEQQVDFIREWDENKAI